MLIKRTVRAHVIRTLTAALSPVGFHVQDQRVVALRPDLRWEVLPTFGRYGAAPTRGRPTPSVHTRISVAVVVPWLEELDHTIVQAHLPGTPTFFPSTATLALEIDHLDPARVAPEGYATTAPEQLDDIVQSLTADVLELGVPYFERHATLSQVYGTLADDTMWGWLNHLGQFGRCRRAILLARHLHRDVHEVEALIHTCRARIQRAANADNDAFEGFIDAM